MIENTFIANSTLDNTSGLLSKYAYDETETNLPIVVIIHGFNLTIDAIPDDLLTRIANQGFFTVAIGMRGRKGATGTRDASARELHDIYDGINYIKDHFPVSDKVLVSGYSGGGGNALGFAVKFPFVSNTIVNHFGMVDYGFDDTESWFIRNTQYQEGIQNFVGHLRSPENMNYYRSRNAYEALKNVQAKLFSYHDQGDGAVSSLLTEYLTDGLNAIGKDYQTKISISSDSVRYLHNMSVSEKTEQEWLPHGQSENKPIMQQTGNLRVIGYVVTDKFKILLGELDNHVADIDYDLSNNQFTIRPLTGQMQVKVIKDKLQHVINISEKTTFIFDGEPLEPIEPETQGDIKKTLIKYNNQYNIIKRKYIKSNGAWITVK